MAFNRLLIFLFLVEVGQFLLELLIVQMILPALLRDQGFDFLSQQPEPRVTVHVVLSELQLACPDGGNDSAG